MSKNSQVKSDNGPHAAGRGGGAGSAGGPKMSEGDWLCSDAECANWNFAWRTSCNRCGAEKASGTSDSGGSSSSYSKKKKLGQEIGKAMAEKSRGLFSADDWQCNKCGNVNWARRHQCNVCNAPRYGEVEERTGYGGGYNDRGVVEYKERVDSDDEWDEFGRKKKKQRRKENSESSDGPSQSKRRKNDRSSSSEEEEDEPDEKITKNDTKDVKEESNRKLRDDSSNEEEDEDDEDDDEDDGDLSKYDLSGWGEDDDDAK